MTMNKSTDSIISKLNPSIAVSNILIEQSHTSHLSEEEKEFILEFQPQRSLIIYGTLAPGKPNHKIITHIKGEWKSATIKGKLENEGWGAAMGFFGFKHTTPEEATVIDCWVLISDELVANWKMLDDFEGAGYKRILTSYTLNNNETGVGYIYAVNEND